MSTPVRFLQIHSLHSYPAALLNRDELGFAKRLLFGGSMRSRISSQCLKRRWRTAEDAHNLQNLAPGAAATRSRDAIAKLVLPAAQEAVPALTADAGQALAAALNVGVYGHDEPANRQILLLGRPEIEYLQSKAIAIAREHPEDPAAAQAAAQELFSVKRGEGANFRAFRRNAQLPAGIAGALFGRMNTADPAANIEAAVHVAHAFTVHPVEAETDYFSAMDDLQAEDEGSRAAHIGHTELTGGLYYGYVTIAVPELVANLEGLPAEDWQQADRTLAGQVAASLLHLIATVSPGAKRGGTAPYAYAQALLVEAGERQPRTLANAFRPPLRPQLGEAMQALEKHVADLDAAYEQEEVRRVMSVGYPAGAGLGAAPNSLPQLAAWVARILEDGCAD